jgi:RNase P subunit RPR2
MTEPIDELLEWLHTFDELQFSCNHRNVIEKIWQIKSKQQLLIPRVSKSFFCQHKLVLDCKEQCFKCVKITNEQ